MRVLKARCQWCPGNLSEDEKTGEIRCLQCGREHTKQGKLIVKKVGKKLHPYAKKHKRGGRTLKSK